MPFVCWHGVGSGVGEWRTLDCVRRPNILAADPMGQVTRIFTVFIVASLFVLRHTVHLLSITGVPTFYCVSTAVVIRTRYRVNLN